MASDIFYILQLEYFFYYPNQKYMHSIIFFSAWLYHYFSTKYACNRVIVSKWIIQNHAVYYRAYFYSFVKILRFIDLLSSFLILGTHQCQFCLNELMLIWHSLVRKACCHPKMCSLMQTIGKVWGQSEVP